MDRKAVYNDHGQMIFRENNGGQHQFLDVRGWGAITKIFKTTEEMEAFQDAVGEWVVDAINQKLNQSKTPTVGEEEIKITKEQAEDILELLRQHEELCHKTQHGTLIMEQIWLREYFTTELNNR